jgi:hypothetical protein
VAAWINQYYHFGVTVTSPIEGCHATLKTYLQRGHGDLRDVFRKLEVYWTSQQANIQTIVRQQQLRPRHSTNIPLFTAVLKHVHGYALQRILLEQAKLLARGPPSGPPCPACGCSIQQSHSIPCCHLIWKRKQETGVIRLEDIHQHWYILRPELGASSDVAISHPLPVLNPLPI